MLLGLPPSLSLTFATFIRLFGGLSITRSHCCEDFHLVSPRQVFVILLKTDTVSRSLGTGLIGTFLYMSFSELGNKGSKGMCMVSAL